MCWSAAGFLGARLPIRSSSLWPLAKPLQPCPAAVRDMPVGATVRGKSGRRCQITRLCVVNRGGWARSSDVSRRLTDRDRHCVDRFLAVAVVMSSWPHIAGPAAGVLSLLLDRATEVATASRGIVTSTAPP